MDCDGPAGAPRPTLAVVAFSKDRPYQLLCSLATLLRHIKGARLVISVLYRVSAPAFQQSYEVVRRALGRSLAPGAPDAEHQLHWAEEADGTPLGALLDAALARAEACQAGGMLFTVDDALWFSDFSADGALRLLVSDPQVFAVHAKLCPRAEYAHPNDKFMRVPPLRAAPGGAEQPEPAFLLYERAQGEYDWNYPWELSASIYRLSDVREMLQAIREAFGSEGVDHPNRLEGFGVRLFKQEKVSAARQTTRGACAARPVVAIITINRVQALFDNPVYGRGGGTEAAPEASPEELDRTLRRAVAEAAEALRRRATGAVETLEAVRAAKAAEAMGAYLGVSVEWIAAYLAGFDACALDVPEEPALLATPVASLLPTLPYLTAYLDSVHVPLLGPSLPPAPALAGPTVSWLVPIHDTPAPWMHECLESIRAQVGMGPGSWELVAVDDGSTSAETLQTLAQWDALPQVHVIRLPECRGVAGALNAGWRKCRGELVARLDADDIAHAERLQTQLGYLAAHPSISILGGGFRTFKASEELLQEGASAGTKQYRMPCHPVLARWRMLFCCALAHPTVTFRRADFHPDVGPYPEDEEAEDHCCWLALPLHLQFGNLADVATFVRRHPASRSATAAAAIKASSFAGVRRFLALHCEDVGTEAPAVSDEDVAVLWGAQKSTSPEQARRLSSVLDALERLFLGLIEEGGGVDSPLGPTFREDFVAPRQSALREYITSSCSKLRGALTMQSLAAGDLSSGTEMMKLWLKGGDAGLKSLGALINAGYSDQSGR